MTYHDDWTIYQQGEDEGAHWILSQRDFGRDDLPSPAELLQDELDYGKWYEIWKLRQTIEGGCHEDE